MRAKFLGHPVGLNCTSSEGGNSILVTIAKNFDSKCRLA